MAEEEAQRRAVRESAERVEREAAEARRKAEEERHRHEEEAKRKAETEAKKRFGEGEQPRSAARPATAAPAAPAARPGAPVARPGTHDHGTPGNNDRAARNDHAAAGTARWVALPRSQPDRTRTMVRARSVAVPAAPRVLWSLPSPPTSPARRRSAAA